jgi:hypothetical protein
MFQFKTTREVAIELGVKETLIENTLRRREIARPVVVGHVRLWTAEEIEALRAVVCAHAARRAARTRAAAATAARS